LPIWIRITTQTAIRIAGSQSRLRAITERRTFGFGRITLHSTNRAANGILTVSDRQSNGRPAKSISRAAYHHRTFKILRASVLRNFLRCPYAHDEKDQADQQEQKKQEFGDSRSRRSNAGESKQCRHECDDQKD